MGRQSLEAAVTKRGRPRLGRKALTSPLSISVSADLYDRLAQESLRTGISVSRLAREVIEAHYPEIDDFPTGKTFAPSVVTH